ncbi:MAG: sugar transferase [Clostridia bacterium]|nr:sugar transferase [Clostridia bacterium]
MSFIKRAFDVVFSFVLLIILIIPFAIISLISAMVQGKPVIFSQKRFGKNGKEFKIYKFRTMKTSSPLMASNDIDDAYITKWGRILRKTSVDELPQLINVLKGDMSLVGPRPLIIEEEEIHHLREENGIYKVRPGITGWAQVNGRDDVSVSEKVTLDKYYVDNLSIGLDIKIFFKSISSVLLAKNIKK